MTSHRQSRSTRDGLPTVAIGAALMAAAPSFGRSRAAYADESSEADCAQAIAEPGRHPPDRQAARPVVPSSRWRFGHC